MRYERLPARLRPKDGVIVERLDDRLHPRSGFSPDVGLVVEHAGDGLDGDPRFSCDIVNGLARHIGERVYRPGHSERIGYSRERSHPRWPRLSTTRDDHGFVVGPPRALGIRGQLCGGESPQRSPAFSSPFLIMRARRSATPIVSLIPLASCDRDCTRSTPRSAAAPAGTSSSARAIFTAPATSPASACEAARSRISRGRRLASSTRHAVDIAASRDLRSSPEAPRSAEATSTGRQPL